MEVYLGRVRQLSANGPLSAGNQFDQFNFYNRAGFPIRGHGRIWESFPLFNETFILVLVPVQLQFRPADATIAAVFDLASVLGKKRWTSVFALDLPSFEQSDVFQFDDGPSYAQLLVDQYVAA